MLRQGIKSFSISVSDPAAKFVRRPGGWQAALRWPGHPPSQPHTLTALCLRGPTERVGAHPPGRNAPTPQRSPWLSVGAAGAGVVVAQLTVVAR